MEYYTIWAITAALAIALFVAGRAKKDIYMSVSSVAFAVMAIMMTIYSQIYTSNMTPQEIAASSAIMMTIPPMTIMAILGIASIFVMSSEAAKKSAAMKKLQSRNGKQAGEQ